MWYEYACNTTEFELDLETYKAYYNKLIKQINSYNNNFGSLIEGLTQTSKIIIPQLASDNRAGYKKFSTQILTSLLEEMFSKCDSYLQTFEKEYNSKQTDEEKADYLNSDNVRMVSKAIFKGLSRINQEYSNIISICSKASVYIQGVYSYPRDISRITQFLGSSSNTSYNIFMDLGRDLVNSDIESAEVASEFEGDDPRDIYLDEMDGEDLVNEHWLKAFACSSIYRPFESIVGEEAFTKALTTLDKAEGALEYYTACANNRKPLYKALYNSEGKVTKAVRVTVKEVFDDIKNDDDPQGALVTITGKFNRTEDGDSFAYYSGTGTQIINGVESENSGEPEFEEITSEEYEKLTDEEKTEYDKKKQEYEDYKASQEETFTSPTFVDELGNEFEAGTTITDTSKLSDVIFEYTESTPNGFMNVLLLNNILRSDTSADSITNAGKRFLYVNTFGDIVLDDNTVVVPAAANATYYGKEGTEIYNPNTAAFMNHYPSISLTNTEFEAFKGSEDKMIVLMTFTTDAKNEQDGSEDRVEDSIEYSPSLFQQDSVGPECHNEISKASAYYIASNREGYSTFQWANDLMPIEINMYNDGSDKIPTMRVMDYSYDFGLSSFGSSVKTAGYQMPIVKGQVITDEFGGSREMFPLTGDSTDTEFMDLCVYVAQKFYSSISHDDTGEFVGLSSRFDRKTMSSACKEAINGLSNISLFVKNSIEEYDSLDDTFFITKELSGVVRHLLNSLGGKSGVIGVENSYQNVVFGNLLFYSNKFLPVIVILIVLYFIIRFARAHTNILYASFGTIAGVAVVYLFLQIIPMYLPIVVNGVVNNVSDTLGYNALYMRLEKYQNTFSSEATLTSEDEDKNLDSASLNLYRLYPSDLDLFCKSLGLTKDELLGSDGCVIDADAGLFVQGDMLKINIDRLMSSLSIKGEYSSSEVLNSYTLTSKKYINNPMDYYCPYYQIVDSFIEQLNNFSKLYSIPSNQLYYPSGKFYKDSFIMDSYVSSDLFLNGDDLTVLKDNFSETLYAKATSPEMFGKNNLDFLGLNKVLVDFIPKKFDVVKDTLWFQTMVRQGFYDKDGGIIDSDKLAELIEQVNSATKQFLIDYYGQIDYISDENMIKITCLYALTEFNREIGNLDDTVYPQALNFEEFSLEDVLLPVITTDYARFIAYEQDIVKYVQSEFGLPGLLLFIIVLLECWVIVNVVTYSLPVLYLVLLVCIVVRFCIKKDSVRSVITGYIKVFFSLCLCFLGFCFVTSAALNFSNSVLVLVFLIFAYSLVLTIIGTIIHALIVSKFDFGSVRVSSSIKKLSEKLKIKVPFSKIRGVFHRDRGNGDTPADDYDEFVRFSYNTSMDDLHGEDVYRGVMENRHNGIFDGYDVRKGRKVKKRDLKKGKVTKNKNDYIQDDDNDIIDEYQDYRF